MTQLVLPPLKPRAAVGSAPAPIPPRWAGRPSIPCSAIAATTAAGRRHRVRAAAGRLCSRWWDGCCPRARSPWRPRPPVGVDIGHVAAAAQRADGQRIGERRGQLGPFARGFGLGFGGGLAFGVEQAGGGVEMFGLGQLLDQVFAGLSRPRPTKGFQPAEAAVPGRQGAGGSGTIWSTSSTVGCR